MVGVSIHVWRESVHTDADKRDVAIIFLSHLMQPVAFIDDVKHRCLLDKSSLSMYSFPLAVLESGPPRPLNDHTARLWVAMFGKAVPFEVYEYLPDGEVVRLKGSWAANVMITRWTTEAVQTNASRRRSRSSWPMTGHMLQSQQIVACDISVWSRVRTGALEPPWLEREKSSNQTAGEIRGDNRSCTQLGRKWNLRLQPQRRNDPMSNEAKSGKFEILASFSLQPVGTTEDGKQLSFSGTGEGQKSHLLFPCISTNLVAAAKRLQRFADTADEWLRTTTTMPDLMVYRFYQFLTIIAREHEKDMFHASATESPEVAGKAAVVAERWSSHSFAARKVVRTSMVPPIDVEIVWRAALLSPWQYLQWSGRDLGGVLDRNLDDLGSVEFSAGRMLASEAWSAAYPGQAPLRPRRVTNPD
jgi:hypothetical protein